MTEQPSDTDNRRVRRRRVLYVAGFDPRGASFYHRLFRDEAAKHSAMTGEPIVVGPRKKRSSLCEGWTVRAGADDDSVEIAYDFLRWDDLVRQHWVRGTLNQWRKTLSTSWTTIRNGLWSRTLRSSYPFAVTMLLPLAAIVGRALFAGLAALLFLWLVPWLLGWPWWSGIPVVAGLAWLIHRKAVEIETKWNIPWIGQIVMFTVRDAASDVAGMEERRQALAALVVEAARDESTDEVLVVGHSHGAPMGISILARAMALDPDLGNGRARLSFLTLGTTSTSLGGLSKAEWFRDDLRRLGSATNIDWVDFTAAPDGACYVMVDPVTVCDPDFRRPAGTPPCPKLLNARMLDLIDPATYNAIRRDRMRVHFQYLLVGDRLGDYDYYKIVTGPLTLGERYKDRPSVTNFNRFKLFAK